MQHDLRMTTAVSTSTLPSISAKIAAPFTGESNSKITRIRWCTAKDIEPSVKGLKIFANVACGLRKNYALSMFFSKTSLCRRECGVMNGVCSRVHLSTIVVDLGTCSFIQGVFAAAVIFLCNNKSIR